MKIAIVELAQHGHYTFVESIASVYSADGNNELSIFTDKKGESILKYLETDKLNIIGKESSEQYISFLSKIKGFDRVIIVTLEPYYQHPFDIAKAFLSIDFGCPINYVIHNINFWYQQSLFDKLKNVFFNFSIKDLKFKLKSNFYYPSVIKPILQKVEASKGFFIVMSEALSNELSQYVDKKRIHILPFSVYKNTLKDKSVGNSQLRVCVPGFLSETRRNYYSIFELLDGDSEGLLRQSIEWDFLGGINAAENGQAIFEKAKTYISKGFSIKTYDYMIPMEEYDNQLSKADIVLGNMHLQQNGNSFYGKSKETGATFTMIKAAKPGILPKGYSFDNYLKSSILQFENYTELGKMLLHLHQNPKVLDDLKTQAATNSLNYTPISIYEKLESSN